MLLDFLVLVCLLVRLSILLVLLVLDNHYRVGIRIYRSLCPHNISIHGSDTIYTENNRALPTLTTSHVYFFFSFLMLFENVAV